MYVIKIDRRKLFVSVCFILGLIVILFSLNAIHDGKMSINVFLASSDTMGENSENIEIFGISEGKVIHSYRPNSIFQKEAKHYLEAVTGMCKRVKVFPDSGYIMKIPLNPPAHASGEWLTASGLTDIDKVYVIFPIQTEPYLLILDKQSRPLCFHFYADTSVLQEYFIHLIKTFQPQKPPEHSMEELYNDITMIMLLPYIDEAVHDYYIINTGYDPVVDPWQPDILSIERPNGYRTFLFNIKLEVKPYLGAHNSIGVDHITMKVSYGEVKVEEYKHIKSYPIPPWLQHM